MMSAREYTVWMVEWPEDDNMPVRYWNPAGGWMRDPWKGLHLVREEDAKSIIATGRFSAPIKATEHKFLKS